MPLNEPIPVFAVLQLTQNYFREKEKPAGRTKNAILKKRLIKVSSDTGFYEIAAIQY
jgi:hypothetical protein